MLQTNYVWKVYESRNFIWDVGSQSWIAETQPGGGGGGGGACTIADGADVAEGAKADVAVQGDNPGTISAKLRGLNKSIAAGIPVTNAGLSNLDVALSTRLKPADTLTKVATVDTITNAVATTVADGSDVTLGAIADAAVLSNATGTISGKLRGAVAFLQQINVVEGLSTDVAVTGDNPGSHAAKLRGIDKIVTDVWDSVNHRFKVDASGVTVPISSPFLDTFISSILTQLNVIGNNQSNGNQTTRIYDSAGTTITSRFGLPTGADTALVVTDRDMNLDRDVYTSGASRGYPAFGVYDDTIPGLFQGSMGAPRMTNTRAMHVQLRNNGGNAALQSANQNSLATIGLLNGTGGTITTTGNFVAFDSSSDLASYAAAIFNIEDSGGPWVGTISFQAQTAGSATWLPLTVVNRSTGAISNFTTTDGIFLADMTGVVAVRAIGTGLWVSGAAQVGLRVSPQSAVATLMASLPAGTNVIGHVIVDSAPTTPVTFSSLPPIAQSSANTIALESRGNLDVIALSLLEILTELRLLNQSFQDWSGMRPRYDLSTVMTPTPRYN